MTKASDNAYPSLLFTEHVDPSNPSAGQQRLFVDTDHILKMVDSSGTVTVFGIGLTDPMTSRGDVIIRDASNVTARLAKGSASTYLGSDGTDVSYSAVTDAKLSTSDITTNDASTSKHGFLKKLDNTATHFMDGTGAWSTPATAAFSGCKAYLSANQTVTAATETAIAWDAEDYDTDSYHNNASNKSRLTIPSTGYYRVNAMLDLASSPGNCYLDYRVNGSAYGRCAWYSETLTGAHGSLTMDQTYHFTASDYIEAMAYRASGTAFGIDSYIEIQRLGV